MRLWTTCCNSCERWNPLIADKGIPFPHADRGPDGNELYDLGRGTLKRTEGHPGARPRTLMMPSISTRTRSVWIAGG